MKKGQSHHFSALHCQVQWILVHFQKCVTDTCVWLMFSTAPPPNSLSLSMHIMIATWSQTQCFCNKNLLRFVTVTVAVFFLEMQQTQFLHYPHLPTSPPDLAMIVNCTCLFVFLPHSFFVHSIFYSFLRIISSCKLSDFFSLSCTPDLSGSAMHLLVCGNHPHPFLYLLQHIEGLSGEFCLFSCWPCCLIQC
jgi:hypothetical protein